jgi:hypothetical protein
MPLTHQQFQPCLVGVEEVAVVGCFLDQEGLGVGVDPEHHLMGLGLVGGPVRCLEEGVVVVGVWWQLGEQGALRMPLPHQEGAVVGMAAAAHQAGVEGVLEA